MIYFDLSFIHLLAEVTSRPPPDGLVAPGEDAAQPQAPVPRPHRGPEQGVSDRDAEDHPREHEQLLRGARQ